MTAQLVPFLMLSAALLVLPHAPALAQSAPCRSVASLACQNGQWDEANAAFNRNDLTKAKSLLVAFLRRPDMAQITNEARRAQALQLLGAVLLSLQDVDASKDASRQALAIWQRRAKPTEAENRRITQLNLANALVLSQGFGEAETLTLQLLSELGPPQAETTNLRIAALEVLCNVLAGRGAPIEELVRKRTEIVALIRGQSVHRDDAAQQCLILARALGNLGDAQMVAEALEPAQTSLSEAENLMRSISLPDSDLELVMLRARWLPLLVMREDRCAVEALARRILPFAEPLGQRVLSQILMQQGENYRRFGASPLAAPLWSRATLLELGMACPGQAGPTVTTTGCLGSSVLIDHLLGVGKSLRFEGQGRAAAGYRSLVQAGDFLRARTLSGFALNRDAANTYATSRAIFRDQITTAWAANDASAVPKVSTSNWTCPSGR
jgi:hypothetical protein